MRSFILVFSISVFQIIAFAGSNFNPKAAQLQLSCDNKIETKSNKFYVVNDDQYWDTNVSFDSLYDNQDLTINGNGTFALFDFYSGLTQFGIHVGANNTTNNLPGNHSSFSFNFEDIKKSGFPKTLTVISPDKTRENSCTLSLIKEVKSDELPIFLYEGIIDENVVNDSW